MAHVGHELGLVLASDFEVFDGLGKLPRPRLHLLEQPRVLDGDDGLVGEGLKQSKLFLAEGPGSSSIEGHDTDNLAITDQWNPYGCSESNRFCKVVERKFGVTEHIRKMHDASIDKRPSRNGSSGGRDRAAS